MKIWMIAYAEGPKLCEMAMASSVTYNWHLIESRIVWTTYGK